MTPIQLEKKPIKKQEQVIEQAQPNCIVSGIDLGMPFDKLTDGQKAIVGKIQNLEQELVEVKGTECEVYSRIVGYFQRTKGWNLGKEAEFKERVMFDNFNGEKINKKDGE